MEPTVDMDLSPQPMTRERVIQLTLLGTVVLTCVVLLTLIAALAFG
jgi:hypothetical protein